MKMNPFTTNLLVTLFTGLLFSPVIAKDMELHFPEDNNPNKDQPKETMSVDERVIFEAERRELHERLKAMSPEDREEYREERLEEERDALIDEKIVLREQRLDKMMQNMTPEERENFIASLARAEELRKERRKRQREKKRMERERKRMESHQQEEGMPVDDDEEEQLL